MLALTTRELIATGCALLTTFVASGSGIGGGAILIPINLFILQLDPREAVALSNVTIFAGAVVNLISNLQRRHPLQNKPLIDWNLVVVMEPLTVIGARLGGFGNKIFPGILTLLLMTLLLMLITWLTARRAALAFGAETKEIRRQAGRDARSALQGRHARRLRSRRRGEFKELGGVEGAPFFLTGPQSHGVEVPLHKPHALVEPTGVFLPVIDTLPVGHDGHVRLPILSDTAVTAGPGAVRAAVTGPIPDSTEAADSTSAPPSEDPNPEDGGGAAAAPSDTQPQDPAQALEVEDDTNSSPRQPEASLFGYLGPGSRQDTSATNTPAASQASLQGGADSQARGRATGATTATASPAFSFRHGQATAPSSADARAQQAGPSQVPQGSMVGPQPPSAPSQAQAQGPASLFRSPPGAAAPAALPVHPRARRGSPSPNPLSRWGDSAPAVPGPLRYNIGARGGRHDVSDTPISEGDSDASGGLRPWSPHYHARHASREGSGGSGYTSSVRPTDPDVEGGNGGGAGVGDESGAGGGAEAGPSQSLLSIPGNRRSAGGYRPPSGFRTSDRSGALQTMPRPLSLRDSLRLELNIGADAWLKPTRDRFRMLSNRFKNQMRLTRPSAVAGLDPFSRRSGAFSPERRGVGPEAETARLLDPTRRGMPDFGARPQLPPQAGLAWPQEVTGDHAARLSELEHARHAAAEPPAEWGHDPDIDRTHHEAEAFLERQSRFPWPFAIVMAVFTVFVAGTDIWKGFLPCGGPEYWVVLLSAIIPTGGIWWWASMRLIEETALRERLGIPWAPGDIHWSPSTALKFPVLCSVAGIVAGAFGVGGGIVKGPLMLELGVLPPVASATSATMILMTSFASSAVYVGFDLLPWRYVTPFFCAAVLGTGLGQWLLLRAVKKLGRPSLIIWSMTAVTTLATGLMLVRTLLGLDMVVAHPETLHWGSICGGGAAS